MAHHCRRLSDPLPFENDLFESCLSSSPPPSSNISFASKPPPPSSCSFNVFKAGCFPLKLKAFSLMANGNRCDVDPVRSRPDARKNNIIGHRRRQELEEEVAELRRMLENEEKVHEILEGALSSNLHRSELHIPSFLPKKMKELLAELVMVEEEISRLESEIKKIQRCSRRLQEVHVNESSEVAHHEKSNRTLTSLDQLFTNSKVMEEKMALETKPVYFINQAIKGDYSMIRGFSSKGREENVSCTINKKGTAKELRLQESAPRKSVEKQSSPKPPRHSSLPRISDANIQILLKVLKEPSISVNQMGKDGLNFQPNKLSEKIMKCLLCIFSRLIRTSRVSELEKLGNLSRSSNSFLRSRSFRFENGLNLNTSLNIQKETGQQDPYGIFEIEDSLVRDIGPYKNLVRCTSNSLDLKSFPSCLQLLSKLRVLLNSLRKADLQFLNHHQKLAFWINVYNICIMHTFLQNGLPSSPEKIIGLKNKAVLNIGGHKLNALAIEHFILRRASNKEVLGKSDKDEKEDAVRSTYGLEQSEPNVTFALCCGSRSSPSVRIYTADGVSAELEKSKLEYLQASIVVTASKKLMMPKLLVSNMHDFAKDLGSLVEWICIQLPSSGSLRKSMAECLKSQSNGRKIPDIVDIIPHDIEFQYLLPV